MANTQPVSMGYSIVDSLGTRASETVYALADPTLTVADQVTQWQAIGALLDVVVGGQIVSGDIRINVVPTWEGAKTAPAADSIIEQTANFSYPVTATGRTWTVATPSWLSSLISGGKVDTGGTGVSAYYGALTGTYTGGVMTNNQYQAVGAYRDSYISFRKHRRQLDRASREEA